MSDQDNFTGNPFAEDADNFKGDPFAAAPAPAQPQSARDVLEQHMGASDFTKSFASTPYRILKSGMQMVGAGDYVPGVVNEMAAEGDKSLAGRIAGDVAGTGGIRTAGVGLAQTLQRLNEARGVVPAVARTAEAATYGAGQGAITSPDQQAEAAKWGAAGGAGGQVLGRLFGGMVRPTAEARVLMDRGVALTPGQAAGPGTFLNKAEQWATSNPVASHFVTNAQRRSLEEANVAAAQTVQNMVENNVRLGRPPREAIEQTRESISNAYTQALEGVSVPLANTANAMQDLLPTIARDHPMIPASEIEQAGRYIQGRFRGLWDGGVRDLTGDQIKQIDSEIGQHIRDLAKSTNAADKTAVPLWRDLQQEVRNRIVGGIPIEQGAQLHQANAAYRQLLTLEKAMLPGNDVFTPRRLKMTLEKMNNGRMPDSDLGRVSQAMSATLPNNVPNSGTAERLIANALPAMLIGGGAGAQGMGLETLGTGMMAAGALGSRPGARFMTGGLPMQQLTAEALRRFVPSTVRNSGKRDE